MESGVSSEHVRKPLKGLVVSVQTLSFCPCKNLGVQPFCDVQLKPTLVVISAKIELSDFGVLVQFELPRLSLWLGPCGWGQVSSDN